MARLKTFRRERVPNAIAVIAVIMLLLGAGFGLAPADTAQTESDTHAAEEAPASPADHSTPADTATVATPHDGGSSSKSRGARLLFFLHG